MTRKPNILIIDNSVHVTGALKSICRTSYDLKQYYNFIFILPLGSQGRSWIENKGFSKVYEVPFLEISKRWKPFFLYFPFLLKNSSLVKRIAENEDIDLIHLNDLYNLVLPTARAFGVTQPYVCHIRFLPEKFPKALFQMWFQLHSRFSENIISVSRYLFNQLPPHPKVSVIYNELPVEERYPDGLPKHTHPTILYLSNVIEGKGHHFALEVFGKIHKSFPDWRMRFVGGDMGLEKNRLYQKKLETLAEEIGVSEKIDWTGFTEDVEREYRQAHIALNFSDSESFSITCLEALFFGCPLIATRCGGPAEIIDHERSGVLVDKGDVKSMESHLRLLMTDAALRDQYSEAGKQIVRQRFSINNTSFRIKEIYDKILGT